MHEIEQCGLEKEKLKKKYIHLNVYYNFFDKKIPKMKIDERIVKLSRYHINS